MPHAAAGILIDPPVSVPSAATAIPAATATAEPPLEPPGDREGSCGLRTGPNAESSLVVPYANSCRLVLPMTIAPARLKLHDDGCIGIGTMTIAHAGRGGRRDAFDVDQILDGDRNAMEWTTVAARGELTIGLRRLTPGFVSHHADERVQFFIFRVDPPEARLKELRGTQLARPELPADLIDRSCIPHVRRDRPSNDYRFVRVLAAAASELEKRRGAPGWTRPFVGRVPRRPLRSGRRGPGNLKREPESQLHDARLVCHVRDERRLSERRVAL